MAFEEEGAVAPDGIGGVGVDDSGWVTFTFQSECDRQEKGIQIRGRSPLCAVSPCVPQVLCGLDFLLRCLLSKRRDEICHCGTGPELDSLDLAVDKFYKPQW